MVLILHIRLIFMKYCALILITSLPVAWIAVGTLSLILSIVVGILYILKAREVATLKKTVFELRDTMRMMRYEEASLSRMLHTASKPTEQPLTESQATATAVHIPEDHVSETSMNTGNIAEAPVVEEPFADATTEEELPIEETTAEKTTIEEPVTEDIPSPTKEEVEVKTPAIEPEEETTNDEVVTHAETEEEDQTTASTTQKQPITGRRPAIPTDLFSAWFAENEETPIESNEKEETTTEQRLPIKETAQTVQETLAHSEEVAVSPTEPLVAMVEETQAETPSIAPAATESTPETELSKEDERFLRKFERVVNTRMRNPTLNVDTIAAQFGIGRTNFYRKVREVTGISPNDYLRKCRMERASELLRTTELTISDICVQVGVTDAQYFSKVFKVYFETTPTAYREKHQTIQ